MEKIIKKHTDIEFNYISSCEDLLKSCQNILLSFLRKEKANELYFDLKYDIVVYSKGCKCVRYSIIDRIVINQNNEISLFVYEEDDINIEEIYFSDLSYQDMLELTRFIIDNYIQTK